MELSKVLQILSNETRFNILHWLSDPQKYFNPEQQYAEEAFEGGVCVNLIQRKSGLSQATTSQYMSQLKDAGLVTATRVGKWTHYRRDDVAIKALVERLGVALDIVR